MLLPTSYVPRTDEHGTRGPRAMTSGSVAHVMRSRIQSIVWPKPAMKPSRDIAPVHDHFAGADAHITHAFSPRILEAWRPNHGSAGGEGGGCKRICTGTSGLPAAGVIKRLTQETWH